MEFMVKNTLDKNFIITFLFPLFFFSPGERLPVGMMDNEEKQIGETDNYSVLKSLRVLLVEDEAMMRNNLATILKRKVKEVYVAENGKVGLELFEKLRPDVVITDLAMPVMDGSEMTRRIREMDLEKCVIVVTAYNEDQQPCVGATHRLLKPVLKANLFNAMVSCVSEDH